MTRANWGALAAKDAAGVAFEAVLEVAACGVRLCGTGVSGREAMSSLYALRFEGRWGDADALRRLVGRRATLTLAAAGERRLLCGLIEEVVLGDAWPHGGDGPSGGWEHDYALTLVPRAALLQRGRRSRVFQQQTVPAIVSQVLLEAGAGLTEGDIVWRLSGVYEPRPFVVQYQESDWAFVSRLLEEVGIGHCFEMSEAGEQLVLCDDAARFSPLDGGPVPYRATGQAEGGAIGEAPQAVARMTRWRAHHRLMPRQLQLSDADAGPLGAALVAEAEVDALGLGMVANAGAGFRTPEQGARQAQLEAERWRCRSRQQYGAGNVVRLAAGRRMQLCGDAQRRANGQSGQALLITAVNHVADERGYRCSVEAQDATMPYRPQRRTPRPRLNGVVPARLDAHGPGEQAAQDARGHYRVVMPFDTRGAQEGRASAPVPLAQPYGGLSMPLAKGADVVLASIDGDPNRLVITGAVADASGARGGLIEVGGGMRAAAGAGGLSRAEGGLQRSLPPWARRPGGQLLSPRHAMPSTYDNAKTAYDDAVTSYNTAKTEYDDATTAYNDAVTAYNSAQTSYDTHTAAYNTAVTNQQTAKTSYDNAKASYDAALASGDPAQIAAAEQALNDAQAALNVAEAAVTSAEQTLTTAQTALNTAAASVTTSESTLTTKQTALNTADANVTATAKTLSDEAKAFDDAEAQVSQYESGSSGSGTNDTWLRFRVPHTDSKVTYQRLGEAPGDELANFTVPNPDDAAATIALSAGKGLSQNTTVDPKKATAGAFAYSQADRTIVTSGNLEEYVGGNKVETVRGHSSETVDGNKAEVTNGDKVETVNGYYRLHINDGTLAVYDAVSPYKLDFRQVGGRWRKSEVSAVAEDSYKMGDTESYFLGYNFAATLGIDSSLFVGLAANAAVGVNLGLHAGVDVSIDIGRRYNFTTGKSYSRSEDADTVATKKVSLRVKPDDQAANTKKKVIGTGVAAGGAAALIFGLAVGRSLANDTDTDKADAGDGDSVGAEGTGAGVGIAAAYTAGLSAALMTMAIVDWMIPRRHAHGQTTLIMQDNEIAMKTDTASIIIDADSVHLHGDVMFHQDANTARHHSSITGAGPTFGSVQGNVDMRVYGNINHTGDAVKWG